jgi:Ca2+-binding RTX toxin-like protein
MFNFLRLRTLLPALAAATTLAAVTASSASADVPRVTVWLNEQSGVLSITGTNEENDYAAVSKKPSANTPGGYVLVVNIKNWSAANFSANCTEGNGQGDWLVTCPALHAKEITFDGKLEHDSFINTTSLPSEAHGGPGLDSLQGGSGPDVFFGGDNEDIVNGNGGDDTLDGGVGTDKVTGGDGTDIASWADAQNSVVAYLDGVANDGTSGENENIPADIEGIQGGPYDDKLSGTGGGNDILLGGSGADDLEGWGGDDTLKGEGGNDTLHRNSGADVLDGGPDSDALSYAGVGQSVYVYQDGAANDGPLGEKDNVTSIENLTGSSYGDDLQGTQGDDVIKGGGGNDKIDAFFGDDTVYGGDGYDHLIGGPGHPSQCPPGGCTEFDTDKFNGGPGSDDIDYSPRSDDLTIALDGSSKSGGFMEKDSLTSIENAVGGAGNDTIYGNADANSLYGRGGSDGIDGKDGNDYVTGGPGNDWVSGGPGSNWVTGDEDNDQLNAVGGNDTLWGGSGRDRVSYWGSTSGVTARIGTGTSGTTGESDAIKGDVEDVQGSIHADKLYGDGANNLLEGLDGPDILIGYGGHDTLQGGAGTDTLRSGGDNLQDVSTCGANADVAYAEKVDTVNADCETVNNVP